MRWTYIIAVQVHSKLISVKKEVPRRFQVCLFQLKVLRLS